MSYAIVGFGKIGQALAHAFARKNIDVTVTSRRPPEALAPQARAIGPTVVAKSLRDALEKPSWGHISTFNNLICFSLFSNERSVFRHFSNLATAMLENRLGVTSQHSTI
jgi:3-hydroxyacyl-CoA dehydrogenase